MRRASSSGEHGASDAGSSVSPDRDCASVRDGPGITGTVMLTVVWLASSGNSGSPRTCCRVRVVSGRQPEVERLPMRMKRGYLPI